MTLTALAAAWVAGLLLGQQAALPVEALALWAVAGAALWSAAAWRANRRGLVVAGCAVVLLLAVGTWWGDRSAQRTSTAPLLPFSWRIESPSEVSS